MQKVAAAGLAVCFAIFHLAAPGALAQPNSPNTAFPQANGAVRAFVRVGDTIYVGGLFTTVNGQGRNRLAAFNAFTGALLGWNPGANDEVIALHAAHGRVYVGGRFTTISGQGRNRLAALDPNTGGALGWNPNVGGGSFPSILVIDSNATTVYAGGDFTTVNGSVGRTDGAAFDVNTGAATGWNPSVTGSAQPHVHALAVGPSAVYIGGEFTTINGSVGRNAIAAVNLTSGAAISWNASLAGGNPFATQVLMVHNNLVYAGGYFFSSKGQSRNFAAAFDLVNGDPTPWNPNLNGPVLGLAAEGSTVYVGGDFTTANGGTGRNRLCAVDATSGALTNWNPNANARALAMGAFNGLVTAGGDFTSVNSTGRVRIAAFGAYAPTPTPSPSPSPTPTISPTPSPFNDASYVSNSVPDPLPAGQTLQVGIVMQNTGNTTWSEGGNYSLAVASDPCGLLSGGMRIPLTPGEAIPPGGFCQFVATFAAPASPGPCSIQLQMIQEFIQYFGATPTINMQVAIPPNAAEDWRIYE